MPTRLPSESALRAQTGSYSVAQVQRVRWIGPWMRANTLVGAFWGLILGLGHQLTQARFGDTGGTISERVLGIALTSLAYAALMLIAGGVGGVFLLRFRQWFALAIAASVLWLVIVTHLIAEAVYATALSPFTVGAFEFVASSASQVLRVVVEGYWGTLVTFGLGTALLVALTALILRRAAFEPMASGRHLAAGVVVGLGVLFAINELVARDRGAWAGVWASTPELAFVESVHVEAKERDALQSERARGPEPGREIIAGRLWTTTAHSPRSDERRPNVLLIMLESVGKNHVGYAGYRRPGSEHSVTPNIDRLAADSLRMRRAWTTATHSNYAQMAILSSLFPRRGAGLDTYKRLDYPRVLLHDFLHALSYQTATISSQDETWQGMLRFESTGTPTLFFHSRDHQGPLVATGTEKIVPDHLTAQRVRRFIQGRQNEPWGAYVNFQMTHFPYKLPPGVHGRFSPAVPDPKKFRYLSYPESDLDEVLNKYDNALAYVDEQVGVLVEALRETDQLDNTVIVLTSDHGELFHQHGMVTHGRSLYDAEARVPLLIHWPGVVEARSSDAPVSHLDILPTLAELLRVAPHPSFQGESFAQPDLIDPKRKAIFMNIQGMRTAEGIVCWPYKLIKSRQHRRPELYNLEKDPREEEDLFHDGSHEAEHLLRLIRAQMKAQLDYHHPSNQAQRDERYAPRMLTCDARLD